MRRAERPVPATPGEHVFRPTAAGTSQVAIGGTNVLAQFNDGHACTAATLNVTKSDVFSGVTRDPGEMPMYWGITNDCSGEYSMALTLCYTEEKVLENELAGYKEYEQKV